MYQRPNDPRFPLWSMDEKPYQILGEAREPLPMRKGDIAKYDSAYVRNGTGKCILLYPASYRENPAFSRTIRTAVDWAEKIRFLVDKIGPDSERIILVMNNLNTHNIRFSILPPNKKTYST